MTSHIFKKLAKTCSPKKSAAIMPLSDVLINVF